MEKKVIAACAVGLHIVQYRSQNPHRSGFALSKTPTSRAENAREMGHPAKNEVNVPTLFRKERERRMGHPGDFGPAVSMRLGLGILNLRQEDVADVVPVGDES
jgi:hypothetical protein